MHTTRHSLIKQHIVPKTPQGGLFAAVLCVVHEPSIVKVIHDVLLELEQIEPLLMHNRLNLQAIERATPDT